jgi:hypothetical protein
MALESGKSCVTTWQKNRREMRPVQTDQAHGAKSLYNNSSGQSSPIRTRTQALIPVKAQHPLKASLPHTIALGTKFQYAFW